MILAAVFLGLSPALSDDEDVANGSTDSCAFAVAADDVDGVLETLFDVDVDSAAVALTGLPAVSCMLDVEADDLLEGFSGEDGCDDSSLLEVDARADATDGAGSVDETALVWFGYGRTFNVSAKIRF